MKTSIIILLVTFSCMLSGNSIRYQTIQQNQLSCYGLNSSILSSDLMRLEPNRTWRLQEIVYQLDDIYTDSLLTESRYCFYYNNNLPARIDSIRVYYWHPLNGNVFFSYTNYFSYDQTGEYLTEIMVCNNELNQNMSKVICSYDEQNRLLTSYYYTFDDSLNDYIDTSRKVFLYGVNCLEQTILTYNNNQSYLEYPYYIKTYTHDQQGRIISITETNSTDSLTWNAIKNRQVSYNALDTTTGEQYVNYFSHNAFFQMIWNEDLFGMVSEVFSDTWWSGIPWDINSRDLYNYNSNNMLNEVVTQINTGGWLNVRRYTYSYDSNNNIHQKLMQNIDNTGNNWYEPSEFVTYTWEQYTANEDNVITPVTMSLDAYPNPFSNNLNMTFQSKSKAPIETKIYNLKGQLVKSLGTSKSTSFTWDGKDKEGRAVSNGIYFIKARQDSKTVTCKIIKMKN